MYFLPLLLTSHDALDHVAAQALLESLYVLFGSVVYNNRFLESLQLAFKLFNGDLLTLYHIFIIVLVFLELIQMGLDLPLVLYISLQVLQPFLAHL